MATFKDSTSGGRVLYEGEGPVEVKAAGMWLPGDLLGYSSGWKAACTTIPAVLVAGNQADTSDVVTAYHKAVIYLGATCSGTPNAAIYKSDTSGEYSTTIGTIPQQVGIMSTSTTMLISPTMYPGLQYLDTEKLYFGTGRDAYIKYDGTTFQIDATGVTSKIKIASSTDERMAFFDSAAVYQQAAIADATGTATGATTVVARVNSILAALRNYGLLNT